MAVVETTVRLVNGGGCQRPAREQLSPKGRTRRDEFRESHSDRPPRAQGLVELVSPICTMNRAVLIGVLRDFARWIGPHIGCRFPRSTAFIVRSPGGGRNSRTSLKVTLCSRCPPVSSALFRLDCGVSDRSAFAVACKSDVFMSSIPCRTGCGQDRRTTRFCSKKPSPPEAQSPTFFAALSFIVSDTIGG